MNSSSTIPVPNQENSSSSRQITDANRDSREQLVNDGKIGTIHEVQLSEASITSLLAIMIDVDLKNFRPEAIPPNALESPADFYRLVIKPMLDRDSVLAKAEVRNSGNGLHVLLHFDIPLKLTTDSMRNEWKQRIIILQRLLPSDPNCPSITALTRPVGSINGKNKAKVVELTRGTPVTTNEVEQLVEQVVAEPFKMVASVLFGEERISPCPNCQKTDSSMRIGNHQGRCYECGKVELEALYDYLLVLPRRQEVE